MRVVGRGERGIPRLLRQLPGAAQEPERDVSAHAAQRDLGPVAERAYRVGRLRREAGGLLEKLVGAGEGTAAKRPSTGLPRSLERGRGAARLRLQVRRLDQVERDHLGELGMPVDGVRADAGGGLLVQGGALGAGQGLVRHVTDQLVLEGEQAGTLRRAVAQERACAERLEVGGRIVFDKRLKRGDVEAVAEDGRALEHGLGGLRQGVEAGRDRRLHGVGQGGGAVPAVERARDLLGEERIPALVAAISPASSESPFGMSVAASSTAASSSSGLSSTRRPSRRSPACP